MILECFVGLGWYQSSQYNIFQKRDLKFGKNLHLP